MADTTTSSGPQDALAKLFPWMAYMPSLAPQQLTQPINPGWSFGNVTINAQNSRAPDVEQAITSKVSYGRQIGRMMDAMEVLVKALPKAQQADPRVKDLAKLAEHIRQIKTDAARARLERLGEDLETLKQQDPAAYAALVKSLR